MFDRAPSDLVDALDRANERVASAQLELLELIREAGELEASERDFWRVDGARDLAHWLSIRYGISTWKANRWIGASRALERLPAVAEALGSGGLGMDKTVELTRFATPEGAERLITWAREVSVASVRRRGDRTAGTGATETLEAERARSLSWWWSDEGRRLGLHAELPAAQGAVVVRALERATERVPVMPGEAGPWGPEARRADGLVALCSATIAADQDPDRATVVLHARVDGSGLLGEAEIEGATPIARSTAERLVCDARLSIVLEDDRGEPIGMGRTSREPSAGLSRQLRYRDRGCRFPGCGTNAFTQAHHIAWWSRGGRTDLENLLLVCAFHHRLVHEHGWAIHRAPDGEVSWITPEGERYRSGPRAPAPI